jgi:AcrR family transcriptional regulator
MPRRYRLGKRAGQKEETRRRILDAAAALYQERGVAQTTIPEVARRADVAPGTVLNHFVSSESLARAVVDEVVGSLRLPSEQIFAGLNDLAERVAVLARELFDFYDRSEPWYSVYARDPQGVPAWADAEASFYVAYDSLVRTALVPYSDDEPSVAILSTLLGGGTYSTLRARNLPTSEIAALVVEVLTPWLERKVAFRERG